MSAICDGCRYHDEYSPCACDGGHPGRSGYIVMADPADADAARITLGPSSPGSKWTNLSEVAELMAGRARVALDSLARVVNLLERIGGYMDPADQQILRDAKAVLVEGGK